MNVGDIIETVRYGRGVVDRVNRAAGSVLYRPLRKDGRLWSRRICEKTSRCRVVAMRGDSGDGKWMAWRVLLEIQRCNVNSNLPTGAEIARTLGLTYPRVTTVLDRLLRRGAVVDRHMGNYRAFEYRP